jgi:hypothetical protein
LPGSTFWQKGVSVFFKILKIIAGFPSRLSIINMFQKFIQLRLNAPGFVNIELQRKIVIVCLSLRVESGKRKD